MNEPMWLSRLLAVGAVLEIPVGVGLLAIPSRSRPSSSANHCLARA